LTIAGRPGGRSGCLARRVYARKDAAGSTTPESRMSQLDYCSSHPEPIPAIGELPRMRFPPATTRRILGFASAPLLSAYLFTLAGGPARDHGPTSARADTSGASERRGLASLSRGGDLAGSFRLRFQEPRAIPGGIPAAVQYTLKNPFLDRGIAFTIRLAPHGFGEIVLTRDGERLPLKGSPLLIGSVGNIVFLAPGEDYSATARLDEMFDLTEPGTYRVRAKKTVDVFTPAKLNAGSRVVASNELTFVVPGP